MNTTNSYFSFSQVRRAFQASMQSCEATVVDGVLPPPCAAVGQLLMQMGFEGLDVIGRDDIKVLALHEIEKWLAESHGATQRRIRGAKMGQFQAHNGASA
jgi:hypothetical protein